MFDEEIENLSWGGSALVIEFTDGTRLFVNHNPEDVELSITGFDEK